MPALNTLSTSLLEAPASDVLFAREVLAHLEAHDGVSNEDHAFIAYKETHRATGAWCIRILSRLTSDAVFHPNAIRLQARAVSEQGKRSFVWGNPLTPKPGDPRRIEYRVYLRNGEAASLEIFARLRTFDHSPDEARIATCPWPS